MTRPKVSSAIIPAAGLGTRCFPATKVVPKALLPVAGKPLIQYAVEELVASGIQTVVLVLAPGMGWVADHFRPGINGLSTLEERQLGRLAELVTIKTVVQHSPQGLADAIACAEAAVDGESFAVILPDVLIDASIPATAQLLRCYEEHGACVIGTQLVPEEEIEKFGILIPCPGAASDSNSSIRVASILEKPPASATPSRYGIVGRYVLAPEIFSCIEELRVRDNNELQLTDALGLCAQHTATYACLVEGEHYDAGNTLGYMRASLAYGLKDPELAPALRRHLAELSTSSPIASRAS